MGTDVLGSSPIRCDAGGMDGRQDTDGTTSPVAGRMSTDDSPVLEGPVDDLSEREREVASLVARGLDNRDIAHRLYLSEGTVRNRVSALLDKLGLSNRTQLAILWINAHR